jgi:hypothetical protein
MSQIKEVLVRRCVMFHSSSVLSPGKFSGEKLTESIVKFAEQYEENNQGIEDPALVVIREGNEQELNAKASANESDTTFETKLEFFKRSPKAQHEYLDSIKFVPENLTTEAEQTSYAEALFNALNEYLDGRPQKSVANKISEVLNSMTSEDEEEDSEE